MFHHLASLRDRSMKTRGFESDRLFIWQGRAKKGRNLHYKELDPLPLELTIIVIGDTGVGMERLARRPTRKALKEEQSPQGRTNFTYPHMFDMSNKGPHMCLNCSTQST
jgi:hypothetical protein